MLKTLIKVLGVCSFLLMSDVYAENKYLSPNLNGWFFNKDTTFDGLSKKTERAEIETLPDVKMNTSPTQIELSVPPVKESIKVESNELQRQAETQVEIPQTEPQYLINTISKPLEEDIQNKNKKYDIKLK